MEIIVEKELFTKTEKWNFNEIRKHLKIILLSDIVNLKGDTIEGEVINAETRESNLVLKRTFMNRNWRKNWKNLFSTVLRCVSEVLPLVKVISKSHQRWQMIPIVCIPPVCISHDIFKEIKTLSMPEIRIIGKVVVNDSNWVTEIEGGDYFRLGRVGERSDRHCVMVYMA